MELRPASRRSTRFAVRGATAIFVGASLFVGVHSLKRDLARAFRDAPRSVFPPGFPSQLERVRQVVPAGAGILVATYTADGWDARLWQRALYPRNPGIVVMPPLPPADELRRLRTEHHAAYILSLGDAPAGLELAWREDLGGVPGGPEHVWLGALAP